MFERYGPARLAYRIETVHREAGSSCVVLLVGNRRGAAINGNIWGGHKSGWVFQREILRLSTIIESQFHLLRQFLNGNDTAVLPHVLVDES